MNKRYLDNAAFNAAMRYLERHHNLVRVVGPHWTEWYVDGKKVANACDSPFPGPEYGSWRWVDRELTIGAEIVVRKSRQINATEAHIINERLEYERRYNRPQPADEYVRLIPEVETAYYNIKQNGGFNHRVGIGSFSIYWNECVRLD